MLHHAQVPILGFAAYSGSGKTTLLVTVLPLLRAAGLRVAVIKHVHHNFDIDKPGKDSYRMREAGASPVLVASGKRWVLMAETPAQDDPHLDDLLLRLDQTQLDLVLVEGFKHESFPKIEVHRQASGNPLLFADDSHIIAIAADCELPVECTLPRLDLNNPNQVAEFILKFSAPDALKTA